MLLKIHGIVIRHMLFLKPHWPALAELHRKDFHKKSRGESHLGVSFPPSRNAPRQPVEKRERPMLLIKIDTGHKILGLLFPDLDQE